MIELIVAPFYAGAQTKGVECGGTKIKEYCRNYRFLDAGECPVPAFIESLPGERMKHKETVTGSCTQLGRMVRTALERGNMPVVLGGDHSLSLGSIPPVSALYDNLGVVYLDAHGDINTDRTSPSGNIHGMTLAAAMGIGHPDLVRVARTCGKFVRSENVFFIGTRSLDPGETELIKEKGLQVFSQERLRKEGMNRLSEWFAGLMKERAIEHLHFSIDIDVIDPGLSPGTGVKEENGMNLEEFFKALNLVFGSRLVCSVDLVEYNPSLDVNEASLDICKETMKLLFETYS